MGLRGRGRALGSWQEGKEHALLLGVKEASGVGGGAPRVDIAAKGDRTLLNKAHLQTLPPLAAIQTPASEGLPHLHPQAPPPSAPATWSSGWEGLFRLFPLRSD